MRITGCIPLPGQGLVARFGDLVAVSDGLGGPRGGPDPLLAAVEHVMAAAGDGSTLVRGVARAALESDRQHTFACAGTTGADQLVVLVAGDSTATVIVDRGQPVTLRGRNSPIPVSRIFIGAAITVVLALALALAESTAADPRLRLDRGIVGGAGLALTVTSDTVPVTPTAGFQGPLGVLVLDDGTHFPLDADYVIGREPALDADVAAGRARPLRIADPGGTVSRLHLRVSVAGGQVEVSDLGSGNGSVLHPAAGEPLRLPPNEPTVIEPGARISVGDRSFEYLPHTARSARER